MYKKERINGFIHRKSHLAGSNMYAYLIRNNFPEGYNVLCKNCNWIYWLDNRTKLV